MRKLFSLLTVLAVAFAVTPSFAADKAEKKKPDPEARFKVLDKDSDGAVSEAEWVGKLEGEKATKAKEQFAKRDANKDGKLTLEEFKTPKKAK